MDDAEMNSLLNFFMYGMGSALAELVDIRLVNIQLSKKLVGDQGKILLQDVGLPIIEDTDLRTIVEKYRDAMKDKEIAQFFEILELDKEHAKLDIGHCIFAPATKIFRDCGMEIVPCPIVTLLLGIIRENTRLHGVVREIDYKPENNSSVFLVDFKEI